jgi:serine/threonine protein phosphatase PrpC
MGCGFSSSRQAAAPLPVVKDVRVDSLLRLVSRERAHILRPTLTSLTVQSLQPADSIVKHGSGTVRVHKATYAANAPSEDRSSLVAGTDFIFAGVWDGHGGTQCSEHVEQHAFAQFERSKSQGKPDEEVWEECFGELDSSYIGAASGGVDAEPDPKALFAGCCCTGCFVDLRGELTCPADHHELLLHSTTGLQNLSAAGSRRRLKTGWFGAAAEQPGLYCQVRVNGELVGGSATWDDSAAAAGQAAEPEEPQLLHTSVQLHGMRSGGAHSAENIVRVEVCSTAAEGVVVGVAEFVGTGLSAFEACLLERHAFPIVLQDGSDQPCGELHCQLQRGVTVGVGNLGDSRAVMGKYQGGQLHTVPLSRDHRCVQ